MSIKKKQKTNPNYRPGIDPPSYRKDTHLKLGEPNPKDLGTDGYEYEEDILEDYKKTSDEEMRKEIRRWLTEETVIVNEKNKPYRQVKNIEFTNKDKPIKI